MRRLGLFALLLAGCVEQSPTGSPNRVGPGPSDVPPAQEAVAVVDAGYTAVRGSLRARRLNLLEVFGNADVVVVEYASPASVNGPREVSELGYVAAAAAVAFPHARRVEAHRFVGVTPKRQISVPVQQTLRAVSGEVPYEQWARALKPRPLTPADSVIHQYAKARGLPAPRAEARRKRRR